MKLVGRDPAVFFGLVASFIQLASGLGWVGVHLTDAQQGAVNASVALVGGLVVAWHVDAEKGLALLAGVAKSLVALAVAFGWHATAETQSSIVALVTMAVAFYVRSQVTAPVPPTIPNVVTGALESFSASQSAGGRHESGESS